LALDLDLYNARLGVYGNQIDITKKKFKDEFANNPSYITAYVNSSNILRDFHISDENDPTRKRIIPKPDDHINIGDYLQIGNNYWLTISISDKNNPIYEIAQIRKCNILPFYFKIGEIVYTTYGYYEKNLYTNSDNQPINLPNDVTVITLPKNVNTSKIQKNNEFYLFGEGWYERYSVEGIDKSKIDGDYGLVILRAKEIPSDETPQEFYNLYPISETQIGDIIITPSTLSLSVGNTKTLIVQVYDKNDILLDTETVTWQSTDSNIATVDQNGLVTSVGVGTCQIKAVSDTDSQIVGICDLEVVKDSGGGWY